MQMQNQEMIQNVIITFKDGQKAVFTGPAAVFQQDQKVITDVVFTPPKPVPKDCEWKKL
jgi:hypothetical protein